MSLVDEVTQVFAPGGVLSALLPNYCQRDGQLKLTQAIAEVVRTGGVLVAEAGTGTGKTFAYLVPAILCGQRVVISTASKALQDQLFQRDIPSLLGALKLPIRVALLKGRSSYLCLYRLAQAREREPLYAEFFEVLSMVHGWAQQTASGDIAELAGLTSRPALAALVTSNRENCLGSECSHAQQCFVNRARRSAKDADLLVVNHHLFFADMRLKESEVADLLPAAGCVIIDEAHHFNDVGVQFLGEHFSGAMVLDFARDVRSVAPRSAPLSANWHLLARDIEGATAEVLRLCKMLLPSEKNQWGELAPVGVAGDDWIRAVHLIFSALDGCRLALEKLDASSLELRHLLKRSVDLLSRLTGCCGSVDSDRIRWLEVSDRHFTIHEMPLDISMAISPKLGGISREGASKQSWVFTSATLAGTNGLSLFMQTCGIAQAEQIFVRSPFDYENQSCLYVPADFPLPSDPSHSSRVAMLVAQAAQVLGGRTLVLTTTLRAMRQIADSLRQYFHHTDGPRVMVQDDMPKVELIKLFGEAGDVRTHGFVLVASATFWEGLDVPGDALQLLVIDKLPFPPLTDPFVLGRTKKLKLDGKSPFKFLHLDAATVALQQGAGRLIRSESDRGILVVCDVRLSEKSYGKTLVSALPPMRRLSNEDEFLQAVSALTKPSTMDPDWI